MQYKASALLQLDTKEVLILVMVMYASVYLYSTISELWRPYWSIYFHVLFVLACYTSPPKG